MIIIRLWHQFLIPFLPRQQLLGQHRECCALRGKGWGKPHSVVNYVFTHEPANLIAYHYLIMNEMEKRGYHPDPIWRQTSWRGNTLDFDSSPEWNCGIEVQDILMFVGATDVKIYSEHNDDYLQECIENLRSKGIEIKV